MNLTARQIPAKVHQIHRFSSIARPLEPDYPTNRAVLVLMPLAGSVVVVARAYESGLEWTLLLAFFTGAVAAMGGWALARELVPDEPGIAFLALAGAVLVVVFVPQASVILLFSAVMLVRVVNHTVGLPLRLTDSLAVSGIVAWAVYETGIAAVGVAAAIAFMLDAWLAPRAPFQSVFGFLWLSVSLGLIWTGRMSGFIASWQWTPLTGILLVAVGLFLVRILRTPRPTSKCDATPERLLLGRVRAGMVVALAVALATAISSTGAASAAGLVWVTLAAVSLAPAHRS